MKAKTTVNILTTHTKADAKKLRTIAENKLFKNRKQFIEYLCQREITNFDKKQLKLYL